MWIEQNRENLTPRKFVMQIIFLTRQFSDFTELHALTVATHSYALLGGLIAEKFTVCMQSRVVSAQKICIINGMVSSAIWD